MSYMISPLSFMIFSEFLAFILMIRSCSVTFFLKFCQSKIPTDEDFVIKFDNYL